MCLSLCCFINLKSYLPEEKLLKKLKSLLLLFIFKLFFIKINKKKIKHIRKSMSRFGSKYGGWFICALGIKDDIQILSLGAGEDISFDVEIANNFNCRVDIFDPTPRAIEHFKLLNNNFGRKSSMAYSNSGLQPIDAYPCENLKRNLRLFKKAVWTQNGKVKFYQPKNPNNVSHSITGFQFKDISEREYLIVKCIDILDIEIERYKVLKVDIEGAEIDVLSRLVHRKTLEQLPMQILVEFDELRVPTLRSYRRVSSFHTILQKKGYELFNVEGFNFSYCKYPYI